MVITFNAVFFRVSEQCKDNLKRKIFLKSLFASLSTSKPTFLNES